MFGVFSLNHEEVEMEIYEPFYPLRLSQRIPSCTVVTWGLALLQNLSLVFSEHIIRNVCWGLNLGSTSPSELSQSVLLMSCKRGVVDFTECVSGAPGGWMCTMVLCSWHIHYAFRTKPGPRIEKTSSVAENHKL